MHQCKEREMGIYIILGLVLLTAVFVTIKIAGIELSTKQIILGVLFSIGATVSITGESLVFTGIFTSLFSIIVMYKGMRQNVDAMWENKDVNDKIDAFCEKAVAKNKRLNRKEKV